MQSRKHYQRVLIVDDMAINRLILASLLASNGIDSDLAESGEECLKLCEERDYDLILLDHRMPQIDGVETLIRLKKLFLGRGKKIPVVCHTTEEARNNVSLYKAAGFADVLFKPIQPQELSDILMSFLYTEKDLISDHDLIKKKHITEELDKLPDAVRRIPGIDPISGISYCETAEDYIEALEIFASSISGKSEEIRRFLEERDLTMMAARLHSLKSTAKLIGAKELSDLAAHFELAAKDGEGSLVFEGAPSILSMYCGLEPLLKKALSPEAGKKPADVLFIEGAKGFLNQAVVGSLVNAGLSVTRTRDVLNEISPRLGDSDVIVYYPNGSASQIEIIMDYLLEVTANEHKSLCLIGEERYINKAKEYDRDNRVYAIYPRPVNTVKLADDIRHLVQYRQRSDTNRTILIVDDDPDFLSIVRGWLKAEYLIDAASSGEETLSYLGHKHPDLILMDYDLPDMDGYETMEKIRRSLSTATVPIIFLTGKSDRNSVMRILKRKPDGYLLKPMTKEHLLDTLERFFEQNYYAGL